MTTARSVLENPALTDARVPDRVWASELFDSLKKNDHQRTLSTYAEARSARARLNVHCYNGILRVLADRGLNGECEEVVADMRARHGVLYTQDGHRDGTIALAQGLGTLGPFALLSHSVDLTEADFAALRETGASIVHNPTAIMSIYGRCPAPELIDAGVRVVLGSDAGAPGNAHRST